MLPAGIRTNNPGNIRSTGGNMPWQGEIPSDRAGFAAFSDPVYGIRAVMKTLSTYQYEYNLHSVRSFISRWAPPAENNTDSYIKDVAAHVGVSPTDFIDVEVPENLIRFAQAIAYHENGKCLDPTLPWWYPDEIYEAAAGLALGLPPPAIT